MDRTMTAPTTPRDRIALLRSHMRGHGVAACLIPSSDPHLSEYLPAHWQGRRWLSGWSGSAGTLVVGLRAAELWVDSRYWEQAGRQLQDSGVEMRPMTSPGLSQALEALLRLAGPGGPVAVDGDVLSVAALRQLKNLCDARGHALHAEADPLAHAWPGRPPLPTEPVTAVPRGAQGHEREDRLGVLREKMRAHGADWHFISSLDDIAWLLGLRGRDVPYNPVFLAHLLVGKDEATLFVDARRMPPEVQSALAADGVALAPYGGAKQALRALSAGATVLIDPKRVTAGHAAALPPGVLQRQATNPSTLLKACKSSTEAASIRKAMVQDGLALVEFFAALDEQLARGAVLTELDIDTQLTAARARQPGFQGPSFATIAAFNANGAMPHYVATPDAHARIGGDGLLLIDSGGQYTGGTTDITRMVAVGTPSRDQRRDCTRVLQGLIALSSLHFPKGTPAPMLDAVARAPLWRENIDYGHGTGHGVGWCLNVHEGPQSIFLRAEADEDSILRAGMVTSIEPGIYRPGQWGVRIENLTLALHGAESAFGRFMSFETLTLCPIDLRCLCTELLAADEIRWLNRYHAQVRQALLPGLSAGGNGPACQWLIERTEPLAEDTCALAEKEDD